MNVIMDAKNLAARRTVVAALLKTREEHAQHQNQDYSHIFRTRTRWELARLSAIAMALELAYAAETSFVSPILLQIGVDHHHMTMAWGLSPLIGFFMSPLLGSLSDRCRMNWGRRRPIITLLSLGVVIGLILVPWGKQLGILLGDVNTNIVPGNSTTNMTGDDFSDNNSITAATMSSPYGVILTIMGMVLLDFGADSCQTPARTYVLDMCTVEDQPRALTTFTVFAGIGGTIGYGIGAIDWESTNIISLLGNNISIVFVLVTIIYVICYIITITTFREIPLSLIECDDLLNPLNESAVEQEIRQTNNAVSKIKEATKKLQLTLAANNNTDEAAQSSINLNDELQYENSLDLERLMEENRKGARILTTDNPDSLLQYLKSIFKIPHSMRMLTLTNLLCWMGHLTYCLYFTDFVGETVFGGDPAAPSKSELAQLYDEGVRFGCWGMLVYALSCSIYSMTVNKVISLLGIKFVYITGILYYGVSMLVLGLWPSKWGVIFFSISAGILYGTLFTIPYILVANYHSRNCFSIQNDETIPLRQERGLGTDVAIISSMIFVAQFIVAFSMGPLVTLLQTTSVILYASTVFAFLAAISAMFVLYI